MTSLGAIREVRLEPLDEQVPDFVGQAQKNVGRLCRPGAGRGFEHLFDLLVVDRRD